MGWVVFVSLLHSNVQMLTMECRQSIELLACNSFSTTKCSTTRTVPRLQLAVVCNPAAGSSRKNRGSETRFAGHHRGQLPVWMISKRICHYSMTGPTTRHESVFVSMNVLIPFEWIIKMTECKLIELNCSDVDLNFWVWCNVVGLVFQ